jgi:hypothetical protein
MTFDDIRRDMPVFAREGSTAIGAVRGVGNGRLTVYIEGYGDVNVTPDNIASAHDGKVVLRTDTLNDDVRRAIDHAHDQEYDDPA